MAPIEVFEGGSTPSLPTSSTYVSRYPCLFHLRYNRPSYLITLSGATPCLDSMTVWPRIEEKVRFCLHFCSIATSAIRS